LAEGITMRIAIVLTPPSDVHFRLAAQVGVEDFVCRYPVHYGLEPLAGLREMRDRADRFGLQMSVVEGYLPIDRIILGQDGRDEQIEQIGRLIVEMGKLGISVLCYNFMLSDWTRTSTAIPTRGGALTTGFDVDAVNIGGVSRDRRITREQTWDHLEYFLKGVVPYAEDAGVKLAMHPDDPPLPSLADGERIMHSVECFERLFQMQPSPANGMCFCQGTFAEMGADIVSTIRRFGPRIHYVHFRDVRGTSSKFVETFIDDGPTDMFAAMRAYSEAGFHGAIRPDHVPQLEGEADTEPGYSMLGRLFSVGYMRGLMHAMR
jgi:mannonate dehydratase